MGWELHQQVSTSFRCSLINNTYFYFHIVNRPLPFIGFSICYCINNIHPFYNFSERCIVFIQMISPIFIYNYKKFIWWCKFIGVVYITARNWNDSSMVFKTFFCVWWQKISSNSFSSFRYFIWIRITSLNYKVFNYPMKRCTIKIFLFSKVNEIWSMIWCFIEE